METERSTRNIPVGEIEVLDGRAIKNAAADRELEESIRLHGLLQPIVVRWVQKEGRKPGDFYRVVAGRRRFAAVVRLRHETVAATVLGPVEEEQATAMSVAENVDRLAVHPLDEADALRKMAETLTVGEVAAKVGRSVTYVYDRVRLANLIPTARRLLAEGKIEVGHAIILARLSKADQDRAVKPIPLDVQRGRSPLWDNEGALFAEPELEAKDSYALLKARTPRELQAWVSRHVRFDPAKDADEILFPETAAALLANTTNPQQKPAKVILISADGFVPPDARGEQRVYCVTSWREVGKRACDHFVLGVFAVGERRGEAIDVCVDKQRCRVHWGDAIRARQKAQKAEVNSPPDKQAVRLLKESVERDMKFREEARNRWEKASRSIFEAVTEKINGASTRADGPIVAALVRRLQNDRKLAIPARADSDAILRTVALFILEGELTQWNAWEEFPKVARKLGVDVKKIVAAANPKPEPEVEKVTKA